jgi:peroxiredoxin Q/BCP
VLEELGVDVLGVSYDTPEKNRSFAETNRLPFVLLSDSDLTLAMGVGADRLLLPLPKRISYLIGADGTIIKAYPSVSPAKHADEVITDYRAYLENQKQ